MTLRIVLTCAEILVLALVVVFFLRRIAALLRHVGDTLEKIAEGVKAIKGHTDILSPGADALNATLGEAAGHLETAVVSAEQLAAG
jgi:uncharacterized protein YoxC